MPGPLMKFEETVKGYAQQLENIKQEAGQGRSGDAALLKYKDEILRQVHEMRGFVYLENWNAKIEEQNQVEPLFDDDIARIKTFIEEKITKHLDFLKEKFNTTVMLPPNRRPPAPPSHPPRMNTDQMNSGDTNNTISTSPRFGLNSQDGQNSEDDNKSWAPDIGLDEHPSSKESNASAKPQQSSWTRILGMFTYFSQHKEHSTTDKNENSSSAPAWVKNKSPQAPKSDSSWHFWDFSSIKKALQRIFGGSEPKDKNTPRNG